MQQVRTSFCAYRGCLRDLRQCQVAVMDMIYFPIEYFALSCPWRQLYIAEDRANTPYMRRKKCALVAYGGGCKQDDDSHDTRVLCFLFLFVRISILPQHSPKNAGECISEHLNPLASGGLERPPDPLPQGLSTCGASIVGFACAGQASPDLGY